jgi:hypothetical protein
MLDLLRRLGEFVNLLGPDHDKIFKSFMDAYILVWQKRECELQGCGKV